MRRMLLMRWLLVTLCSLLCLPYSFLTLERILKLQLVLLLVVIALLPRVTPIEFVIVGGGSMEPTIPFGSVAIMRAIDGEDVEAGMIIKYRDQNGRTVTHRAVSIDPATGNITTRGDNNPANDLRPVPPERVTAETDAGPVQAILFAAHPDFPLYRPEPDIDELADILASAVGHIGTMAEYLLNTVTELERHGVHDLHLWRLQEMVAERLERLPEPVAAALDPAPGAQAGD